MTFNAVSCSLALLDFTITQLLNTTKCSIHKTTLDGFLKLPECVSVPSIIYWALTRQFTECTK
jgi:hypothetical protein